MSGGHAGRTPLAIVVPVLLLLAAVLGSLPFWAGDYWTRIWTGVAMWAGLAAAWNIIGGYAGYISFGQSAALLTVDSSVTSIRSRLNNGTAVCMKPV